MTVVYHTPTAAPDEPAVGPGGTFLAPNVPNPFANDTALRFRLGRAGHAVVLVAEPSGRVLRRLADRAFPAGYTELRWDGRDDSGRRLPAGVYFVRLETDEIVRHRRVLLAR
jgi:hypothetical protein